MIWQPVWWVVEISVAAGVGGLLLARILLLLRWSFVTLLLHKEQRDTVNTSSRNVEPGSETTCFFFFLHPETVRFVGHKSPIIQAALCFIRCVAMVVNLADDSFETCPRLPFWITVTGYKSFLLTQPFCLFKSVYIPNLGYICFVSFVLCAIGCMQLSLHITKSYRAVMETYVLIVAQWKQNTWLHSFLSSF